MEFRPEIYKDHRISELWGVQNGLQLTEAEVLESTLMTVARKLELTVVNSFTHTFEPHGLSSVLILAESHLAVHTWPENRYLHLDVFTCSADTKIADLENVLREEIPNRRMATRQIVYG